MNRNMFSPEMMSQMKNMMNPQMMKQAADTIGNMNDQQLGAYLASTGMGHISPSAFRAMSGNLKNMDDKDLERMKNNANIPPTFNPSSNVNSTPSNSTNNTNSSQTKPTTNSNKPNYDSYEPSRPKTLIEKLEEIKNNGNEFFRKGSYKEACEKYYEALNELEYIPDSEKVNLKNQIEDLEVVCRLNIANSKLKMEDYDLVIHECLKVLKKKENFKAHYRAAVSFYKKSNYAKAKHHFTKAREVNKTEEAQTIENYMKECERNLSEMEKEREEERKAMEAKSKESEKNRMDNEIKSEVITNSNTKQNENVEKNIPTSTSTSTSNSTGNETGNISAPKSILEKLKEIVKSDATCNENNSKNEKINTKSKEDEIVIEDEKISKNSKNDLLREEDPNTNRNKNNNFSSNYQSTNSIPTNSNSGSTTGNLPYNNEMFSKAEKELSSMV
jgi:tetratricopeptide (TPR) repeat protein